MPLKNPSANHLGGLNSLIGIDPKTVYDVKPPGPPPTGFALDATLVTTAIGGAQTNVENTAYAGKLVKLEQAAGAVADGAVVANTYLNRSGKALVANQYVFAGQP